MCACLQIQLERRKVLMLQQQLEQLQSKLGTTRTAMGGIFSAKEKSQALQKQIKILENRLEKQFIKYNEVCTAGGLWAEQHAAVHGATIAFIKQFARLRTWQCKPRQAVACNAWQAAGWSLRPIPVIISCPHTHLLFCFALALCRLSCTTSSCVSR
jgi:hypothetical protein